MPALLGQEVESIIKEDSETEEMKDIAFVPEPLFMCLPGQVETAPYDRAGPAFLGKQDQNAVLAMRFTMDFSAP
jgi:hypothetical protein